MSRADVAAQIPAALRPLCAEVAAHVHALCDAVLDEHHEALAAKAVAALARKRPSPLLRGRVELWASGAVHAVISVNGGFGADSDTGLSPDAFARHAGVSRSSVENKSREIRRLLGMTPFHGDWLLPGTPDPYGGIALVGGLYVDTAAELVEACRGASADILHRYLASSRLPGAAPNAAEAVEVFCEVHHDNADEAEFTAVLLAVQPRWGRHARALLEAIEDSGIMDEAQLDAAAEVLFGEAVRFEHPAHWYADGWVSITLGDAEDVDDVADAAARDEADDGPVVSVHPVPAEARRWAVARLVVGGNATVADVLARSDELSAPSRVSVQRALLDVYDRIPSADRGPALAACLSSSHAVVRRRALEQVAREEGIAAAAAVAAGDGDAQVRAWGTRLDEPGMRPDAQASLF